MDTLCSYASSGCIYNSLKTHSVIWLINQAQISNEVFDFFSVIEFHSTNNLVGNAVVNKGFFYRTTLGVSSVQNSIIIKFSLACIDTHFNSPNQRFALFSLISNRNYLHRQTSIRRGPKLFIGALGIFSNNCMGCIKNMFGTAVILLELYDSTVFVVFFEF